MNELFNGYGRQAHQIKETIRTLQSENAPATERELFNSLRQNTDTPFGEFKDTYDDLRKRGEIYNYPSGAYVLVKVTDDCL